MYLYQKTFAKQVRSIIRLRRWLQDTTKRNLAYFSIFFTPPPVPVTPGLPEDDPTIDENKRPGFKKLGWLKLLAGFTRKKASTRRVNRKTADSTRNQRVFFSRYLAANYGLKVPCATSKSKQLFFLIQLYYDFSAVTHNERRFQFRLLDHLFRIVPGFMGTFGIHRW